MKKAALWAVWAFIWIQSAWYVNAVRIGTCQTPTWDTGPLLVLYGASLLVFLIGVGILCLFAVGIVGWLWHHTFGDGQL